MGAGEKAMSIRSKSSIKYLGNEIMNEARRGSATGEKLIMTLNGIHATGIKSLKNLEQSHIDKFLSNLSNKVNAGVLSKSSFNSYATSINHIVNHVNLVYRDKLHKIEASDWGQSRNMSENANINKANSREDVDAVIKELGNIYKETGDKRALLLQCKLELQHEFGLRYRESQMIKLLTKDISNNILQITMKGDGAKNSRAREIPIVTERQREVFYKLRDVIKENGLKNLNVGSGKEGCNNDNYLLDKARERVGVYVHFHGERHERAHEIFTNFYEGKGYHNIKCIAETGESKQEWFSRVGEQTGMSKKELKSFNDNARQAISNEFGHKRLRITNSYLGEY